MGLLDKLFSKEAQKKMNELVKDATKKINDTIDELKSGIEEGKKGTSADSIKESLNGQAQVSFRENTCRRSCGRSRGSPGSRL